MQTTLARSLRLSILALVAASLAACATAPASDLTPPPRKASDAKTQLESGRR